MTQWESDTTYYCDNSEVVSKLQKLAVNPNFYDEQYKTCDHDAVLEIKKYLPSKLKAHHVKAHQDNNSRTKELTLSARLNIAADKLIGQNAKAPLMTNIKNTPIAVYVNNKYIPNNYVSAIRKHCGETEARNFMMIKYAWSSAVISNIEWKLLDNFINRKSYSIRKTIKKFIHSWLASGKKNYGQPLLCPYCKEPDNSSMSHDHFITCSDSTIRKEERLTLLEEKLKQLKTPTTLQSGIIRGVSEYYNNITHIIGQRVDLRKQHEIGWEHFSKGRVSINLTQSMSKHYKKEKLTGTFTGIRWTKTMIEFMITTHINEWYLRCQLNSKPSAINHNNKMISFEKEALLITIQHLHEKSENLSRQRKDWFRSSIEEYDKLNVKQLRQWIQNTKKLFKYEKLHQHNTTKITDYFNYNITDTHPKNRQKFKNNTSNLNTSTVVNNNNQYKHNKRTDTKNNNIEIIDKNSVNGKYIRNQSRNELLVNDNSNNMVQIQKEQLEYRDIISTYESINNHNNKDKQKDIYENKINTKIVRNSNPSIDSSEVLIPQKRNNESLNNDYEMGTGTYNTTRNKFAQKTKSPESEFHTQENIIQSKNQK